MLHLCFLFCLALAQDQPFTLEPKGASQIKSGYYPIRIILTAEKPHGILKEPAYASPPKYGVIRLGNGPNRDTTLAVDTPSGGDWKIYIDKTHSGDLTQAEAGPWTLTKQAPPGRSVYGILEVTLRASYGTAAAEISASDYTVSVYQFTDNGTMYMYRGSSRNGRVLLGGKTHQAILMENDADAIFDKTVTAQEDSLNTKPLWLKVDTADDGTYPLTLDIRAPFLYEGHVYEARINTDGSSVEILSSTKEPIDLNPSFYYQGKGKEEARDFEGAIAVYTKAIETNPKNVLAYGLRAAVKKTQGDLDGAIADLGLALDRSPKYKKAWSDRGFLKLQKHDYDGAIADFDRVLELNPLDANSFNNRGFARKEKGKPADAAADFTRAIELNPRFLLPYQNRGDVRRESGQFDAAMADYTQALSIDPKNAYVYNLRGVSRHAKRDYEGAMADYTTALTLDPKFNWPYGNRGEVQSALGNHDAALADYGRAIELTPNQAFYYCERGLAKVAKGDTDGALADFVKGGELQPETGRPHYLSGCLQYSLKAYAKSLAELEQAVRIDDPYRNPSRLRLWLVRTRMGNRDQATQELREGLQGNPDKADAWALAVMRFLVGTAPEAELLKAMESENFYTARTHRCEALFYAGSVHLLAGDNAGARTLFLKCVETDLRLDPDYQGAVDELKLLKDEK